MDIEIRQRNVTPGDEYDVLVNAVPTYFAASKPFHFLSEINLYEVNFKDSKLRLKKKWGLFSTTYDVVRSDISSGKFTTVNDWKFHFRCQFNSDLYEIFGHLGLKYSVYKNGKQVAWWVKERVTWFEADNYKITADNDCDKELIIGFCLIIDDAFHNRRGTSFVSIDLGNFSFQAKEFDKTWEPRE